MRRDLSADGPLASVKMGAPCGNCVTRGRHDACFRLPMAGYPFIFSRVVLFLGAILSLASPARAQDDFSARWDEIKKNATDAELYRFLYELPKGGDLHNHLGGENFPEDWYSVATNKAVVHDEFYVRTKLLDVPDATEALLYDI